MCSCTDATEQGPMNHGAAQSIPALTSTAVPCNLPCLVITPPPCASPLSSCPHACFPALVRVSVPCTLPCFIHTPPARPTCPTLRPVSCGYVSCSLFPALGAPRTTELPNVCMAHLPCCMLLRQRLKLLLHLRVRCTAQQHHLQGPQSTRLQEAVRVSWEGGQQGDCRRQQG